MSFYKHPLQNILPSRLQSAYNTFGAGWFFLFFEAKRRSVEEANALRLGLTPKIKQEFRRAARNSIPPSLAPKIFKPGETWEVHHVVSLALGGDHRRLVLANKPAHDCVHFFLHDQIADMKIGEIRTIRIPVRKELVWTDYFFPRALRRRYGIAA